METDKLIAVAKELGYSGADLRKWVDEEKVRIRAERAEEREHSRLEREAADRTLAAECVKLDKEREVLQLRIAARDNTRNSSEDVEGAREEPPGSRSFGSPHKLIPQFNERRDDLDAYLQRFERTATGLGWPQQKWATNLGLCLTGEALTVVGRMTPADALDYAKVKLALFQRFRYTKEGYRDRFRESKPEDGETRRQFAARLAGYFDRWIEIAGIDKTFEALRDNVLVEQFLLTCSSKLAIFLRERDCQGLDDVAAKADLFLEAQGQPSTSKQRGDEIGNKQSAISEGNRRRGEAQKGIRCFLCGKSGHRAENCRSSAQGKRVLLCWNCGRSGHKADVCREKPNDRHQASCLWTMSPGNCDKSDDCCVTLSNGDKIPVVNAAMGRAPKFLVENMPVVEGRLGDHKISVLRDTGCNTVVVREELIPQENLTGKSNPVFLLDRTVRYLPEAEIFVQTPYYTGKVLAKCVSNPLYDLVLGNIPGIRDANDPNPAWVKVDELAGQRLNDEVKVNRRTGKEADASKNTDSSDNKRDLLHQVEPAEVAAARETGAARNEAKSETPLSVPQVAIINTTAEELAREQRADGTLTRCFDDLGTVTRRHKCRTKFQFFMRNNLLYRTAEYSSGRKTEQLVLPKKFRAAVVALAHDSIMSGHQGMKNTLNLVAEEFFWPSMQSEIKRYVRSCDICQRTIPKGKVGRAPLGRMPTIETPFQRVAVDLIGPIAPRAGSGNRYILTMVDMATRYPDAVAMKSIGAQEVAEALMEMFTRYGVPREILSDRGSCFTSELMKEVSRLLSMKHLMTTPYHPMGNGLVERLNGTIKQMLKRMCQERPRDWDRYLPALLFAYREVPQSSLKFSPFELLYGRRVRGPLAILKEVWSNETLKEEVKTSYGYMLELREKLEETCKLAHSCLEEARAKYKGYYDRKSSNRKLKQGDLALILLPTDKNKMIMQWKGPFLVLTRRNEVDYELDMGGRTKTFHINMLKKYEEREGSRQEQAVCNAAASTHEMNDSRHDTEEDGHIPMLSLTKQQGWQDVVINGKLERDKSCEARELIKDFSDIFSDLPGRTNLMTCDLQLTTPQPIHVRQYPLPLAVQDVIENEITEMLKLDVIERCTSSYNAPVVIVKKKDGSNRFCIDYRRLNDVIHPDAEPIPRIDMTLVKAGQKRFFSKLDVAKGYWQIPMDEHAKEKTAFSSTSGHYQFKFMPFGLKTASATFTKLMRKLQHGVRDAHHYIDDILVATSSWEDHIETLRTIFERLRAANITVKPKKCQIGFEEISFLGHEIGMGNIAPDAQIIERVRDAPRPQTKRQVRSFLGLTGFYRQFVPNYAEVAAPLVDLTRKGAPNGVEWGARQEEAFTELKRRLDQPPILLSPNPEKEFVLRTDASEASLGAVLLQEKEGMLHPVAYASRKLTNSEKNFATVEKECLALVWAVGRFKLFLYGRTFRVQTDHQPLEFLNKARLTNSRVMRWSMALQDHSFNVEYIKGRDNVGADFLSRL